MNDIAEYTQYIMGRRPERLVLSKPRNKDGGCIKIVLHKRREYYQAEKFIGKQVFHENIRDEDVPAFISEWMPGHFYRLNAFSEGAEYAVMASKSGTVTFLKNENKDSTCRKESQTGHDREKKYILPEGAVIPPLADMGVFTPEGKVAKAMHEKYRQINRFLETIDDEISKRGYDSIKAIDFGCGKGYLTFLLYYYLTRVKNIKTELIGVDLKADVMELCGKTAEKYGYEGLRFVNGDIRTFEPPFRPDMIVSLHACDTATDCVLYNAIRWKAKLIFAMPCCQHELNGMINSANFPILTRYGVLKENLSAILTDAIRANLLAYCGYKVQALDIVNPLDTPKNIMLRAVYANSGEEARLKALDEVKKLCREFSLRPTLAGLLGIRLEE